MASPPPPCLADVTDDFVWAANTGRAADILWAIGGLAIVSVALFSLYGSEQRTKFTFRDLGSHWTAVVGESMLVGIYLAIWARTLPCFFIDCHIGDSQVAGAVLFISVWPFTMIVLIIVHALTPLTPLWVENHAEQVGASVPATLGVAAVSRLPFIR